MPNVLLWCKSNVCGRVSPHRTRRRSADGVACCMGRPLAGPEVVRGAAKASADAAKAARETAPKRLLASFFQPRARLRGKGPGKLRLKACAPTPLRRWVGSSFRTPDRHTHAEGACPGTRAYSTEACAPAARAEGVSDDRLACGLPLPGFAEQGDTPVVPSGFPRVEVLIDELAKTHNLPASGVFHLKGTAASLIEKLERARPCRKSVSAAAWSLAIFRTALALSPGPSPNIVTPAGRFQLTEERACALVERDPVVRRAAIKQQAIMVNLLFGSSAATNCV